jgi:hypothetical protein
VGQWEGGKRARCAFTLQYAPNPCLFDQPEQRHPAGVPHPSFDSTNGPIGGGGGDGGGGGSALEEMQSVKRAPAVPIAPSQSSWT